jgi:lipopolysaccharide export system protein LptC
MAAAVDHRSVAGHNPPCYTARQSRALPGGRYDAVVAVLRWLLPALALVLLAVIIIWPLSSAQEFSFLLAKDKVALSPDRLRIDNAIYRGETSDGKAFEIRAADAVQHSSSVPVVQLTRLSAYLADPSGPASVTAPTGRYEMDNDLLIVDGPVRVDSAAGYTLDAGKVIVSLVKRTVATDMPVTGTLPIGKFSGDSLHADISGRVVTIDGHVRLHIQPVAGK